MLPPHMYLLFISILLFILASFTRFPKSPTRHSPLEKRGLKTNKATATLKRKTLAIIGNTTVGNAITKAAKFGESLVSTAEESLKNGVKVLPD
jgi:hypothetical protein